MTYGRHDVDDRLITSDSRRIRVTLQNSGGDAYPEPYPFIMPITEFSEYVNRFNCVLLPEERGKLQALADDAGLRESEIVRQLIEAAYVGRFGKRKPPAVRPKYNSGEARARNK